MDEMNQALEDLLVCQSLSRGDRDCVEMALEDGYAALDDTAKARLRRLLNRQSVGRALSPLQRYRAQHRAVTLATRHHLRVPQSWSPVMTKSVLRPS